MSNTFSLTDYERMMKQVSEKKPLIIDRTIDKHRIHLYSSTAACDWNDDTKKGDYIICSGYHVLYGNQAGHGNAYGSEQFVSTFSTYEKFINYINYVFAKQLKAPEFKRFSYEYPQLSMF